MFLNCLLLLKCLDDVEKTLRCPVCLNVTDEIRLSCEAGHHVCRSCLQTWKRTRRTCPTCRLELRISRNIIAEELSSQIKTIRKCLEPGLCVGPLALRECQIEFCNLEIACAHMHAHIQECHPQCFIPVTKELGIIGQVWNADVPLVYKINFLKDCALMIKGIGLFQFSVFINHNGDMMVDLRSVNLDSNEALNVQMVLRIPRCTDVT